MRLVKVSLLALLVTAGISAIAQTVEGQDIEAIKQRSAAMRSDAEALVDHVKDRGDRFRDEAVEAQAGGTDNMRRVAAQGLPKGPGGAVDFDEIVQGAATNASSPRGDAPQFIVFASLSMPPASLRQMITDTARAGGVVVFRGFPDNSAKAFVSRLAAVVKKDDMPNIGIDPRLFRAFDVQAVPTYVAVSSDFDLCAGFKCQTKLPPHDRMSGNVTVDYALSSFAQANGPGARVATVALANMQKGRQP
jgi:conjugal transfer pilus assembly protein TrbC